MLTKILFTGYLILLIWVILLKLEINPINISHFRNINLIPFYYEKDINHHFHIQEIVENILIFVPFGIYLKCLKKEDKFIIISAAILSLTLEILQFVFAIGITDITDIITNTLEAICGIAAYEIMLKIFKSHYKTQNILNILTMILMSIFIVFIILLMFILN